MLALVQNMIEYENRQYHTPILNSFTEAWTELGIWVQDNIPERHTLLFRDAPKVESQFNFDKKRDEFQGFVRFCFDPKEALEKDSYLKIPSIGEA